MDERFEDFFGESETEARATRARQQPHPRLGAPESSAWALEASLFAEEATKLDEIPERDPVVKRVTLYPRIPLGGEGPAPAVTGVYVPEAVPAASPINAIVYLHGHHRWSAYPPEISIYDHWDGRQHRNFAFREGLRDSGRAYVLVAPTLGPYAQAGSLVTPGGFDAFMERVRAALVGAGARLGFPATARWGNLVLACHSGGGAAMLAIATGKDQLAANVSQCWGFDCLYSDSDVPAWLDWARPLGRNLYVHYGDGGTAARALRLRDQAAAAATDWGGGRIVVDGSGSLDHFEVPIHYWRERLGGLPRPANP